ncbi:LysR substrate-binding domain-containing protein [Nocardioides salsibiostraticola]
MTFRVGFVTGATPDKWARTWRDRLPRARLELVPVTEDEQEAMVRSGELSMALARLPVDRTDLHCITLYDEVPVVVAGHEHLITAVDEVSLEDLDDEQLVRPHRSGWTPSAPQLDWLPMSEADAIETVSAGTGVVLVPMSIARLHQRRDVASRPVVDLPSTSVGLIWLIDNDDPLVQTFIGIVRGRSERSSR